MLLKQEKRKRRHKRARSKIFGTSKVPRLCVFRSANHIYAQLIDDEKGHTILSLHDLKPEEFKTARANVVQKSKLKDKKIKDKEKQFSGKVAVAYKIGKTIAEKAIEKKIKKVIFDRGGYKYHGRVKALAEGAREGGLEF